MINRQNPHAMSQKQFDLVQKQLDRLFQNSPFYQKKFKEFGLKRGDIKTIEDFTKLPFTSKFDLREAYPLGLQVVPDEEIIRIHSSSGTTGVPVIIPYTQQDVDDWAEMMGRCMTMAGITNKDRVQVTPGYGLWTAGIGFQAGAERIGAMSVPVGPGNTEKQLEMMVNLKTTVLGSTSSFALLLAELVAERGLGQDIALTKGIIGSERWGKKMRQRIIDELGIEVFDIYGLTEIYGPGISIDCPQHEGLHYFNDYLYFEIIDPETEEVLPTGELGELVITTLRKEGAPLIRYRTRDLTRLLPNTCSCGREYPMHDVISGRTDDVVKVRGVNIAPSQIDILLSKTPGASSEYRVEISKLEGKDVFKLIFEVEENVDALALAKAVTRDFKQQIGITPTTEAVPLGSLPRSEKKTARVLDSRYQ